VNLFLSLFAPSYPQTLVYMLQSTEYQAGPYLKWFWRTKDFSKVMYRRKLHKTRAANLLLLAISLGMLGQVLLGLGLLWLGHSQGHFTLTLTGTALIILYPFVGAHLVVLPLELGRIFIVQPRQRKLIAASRAIFSKHPGLTIAVAGSYGKTSMKELLKTVLKEGKSVAATPANKNVAVSHAYFAQKLTGQEDILIIEYGEGAPGDINRFANNTQPDIGIITGLAPAHLDNYPSLQAAGQDIFSLDTAVGTDNIYVNDESEASKPFIKPGYHTYNSHQVLDWKISNVKVDFSGTSFVMSKGQQSLHLHSGLLGRHQVGPLAVVAALANQLGLTKPQIEAGIAKTQPFEHRMQPRLVRGAWILDDTYNGNIDGLKAGLALLKELPAKRRIYVTPGLVEQGVETKAVHIELGKAIAATKPDKLVLMSNSVTSYIRQGLKAGDYQGEVQIEPDPLNFYTNIEHFLASGDVVLMQNDWTDNYN
jgi:UDP-N-acetylmuramoyl-tripeptide--D-alanyl-D-alanine ligase